MPKVNVKKANNKKRVNSKATEKKNPYVMSKEESGKLLKDATRAMKRHGCKTVDEYIDYIDSKRGY